MNRTSLFVATAALLASSGLATAQTAPQTAPQSAPQQQAPASSPATTQSPAPAANDSMSTPAQTAPRCPQRIR